MPSEESESPPNKCLQCEMPPARQVFDTVEKMCWQCTRSNITDLIGILRNLQEKLPLPFIAL